MMLLNFVWPAPAEAPAVIPRRIEYQLDGVRVDVDAADVGSVPFEDCEPERDFPTWPGKQHYSGLLYMQGVQAHVGFESLAERSFLIELDRLEGVRSVTSQPMWIRWVGAVPGIMPRTSSYGSPTGRGCSSMCGRCSGLMPQREQYSTAPPCCALTSDGATSCTRKTHPHATRTSAS